MKKYAKGMALTDTSANYWFSTWVFEQVAKRVIKKGATIDAIDLAEWARWRTSFWARHDARSTTTESPVIDSPFRSHASSTRPWSVLKSIKMATNRPALPSIRSRSSSPGSRPAQLQERHRPHRSLVLAAPDDAMSSRIGLASRSDDTPPAAGSSTSTATQPELPRQRPTRRKHISFDASASPPHHSSRTPNGMTAEQNAFPAPTGHAGDWETGARCLRRRRRSRSMSSATGASR